MLGNKGNDQVAIIDHFMLNNTSVREREREIERERAKERERREKERE